MRMTTKHWAFLTPERLSKIFKYSIDEFIENNNIITDYKQCNYVTTTTTWCISVDMGEDCCYAQCK